LLLVFLGGLYYLSPLNHLAGLKVIGNSMVETTSIMNATKLTPQTSMTSILLHQARLEKQVTVDQPRIKSTKIHFNFPNRMTLEVKEFSTIGYVQQAGKDYALLSNGLKVGEKQVQFNHIAGKALILQEFSDSQVKTFSLAFNALPLSLRSMIRTVSLTPSQATSDLITLKMSDNNQVVVPLSQLKEKLVYYPSVASQVKAPTTVDMEVGIFSAPTAQYEKDFAANVPAPSFFTQGALNGASIATNPELLQPATTTKQ
jgi:cell division protein FtsQ